MTTFEAVQVVASVPRRKSAASMYGCSSDVLAGQPGPARHLCTPIAMEFAAMCTAVADTAVTAA